MSTLSMHERGLRAALVQRAALPSALRAPLFAVLLVNLAVLVLTASDCAPGASHRWSSEERAALRDLQWIGAPVRPDPSNRYADDPAAARLGRKLFFDARLSENGAVSCATCHDPLHAFQDGAPLARGLGTTARRTMPLAGAASSPWLFWDGRKDSLWSQALGPLESDVEHGADRVQVARLVARAYRAEYEAVFGALPDLTGLPEHATPLATDGRWDAWRAIPAARQSEVNRVFANVGKAIAAYERTLMPRAARFDRYAAAVLRDDLGAAGRLLSDDEAAGLRLFLGKGQCTQCHNGPRFTNDDFANTGVPAAPGAVRDAGHALGARALLQDEFNCLGPYSDASPDACRELAALALERDHAEGAFKVPSLRDVAQRAPFMHAGQLTTLEQVVSHYDRAPAAPVGQSELRPLGLDQDERRQLVAFLETLSAEEKELP